jgi:hypothetical protein
LKKALSYIILVFFLFNSMGYYLLFELDRFMVKKEMDALIQNNQVPLAVIRIADAGHDRSLRRIDKHEIEYKGMLYDVVREIREGNDRVFICLHDSKEEGLFAALKKAHFHKLHQALWDHLIKVAFPEPPVMISNAPCTELTYPHFKTFIESSLLTTWSPPPETSRF